jgi:hypothetical protein
MDRDGPGQYMSSCVVHVDMMVEFRDGRLRHGLVVDQVDDGLPPSTFRPVRDKDSLGAPGVLQIELAKR